MKVSVVLGARPNVVKAAPIVRSLKARGITPRLIHTGQHRTDAMFGQIMRDLEMPEPDVYLGEELNRARHTHAGQTAAVMEGVERDLQEHRPVWLVVLGDVDSTLGAALAAVKLGVRVAHVEAGYRSGDWTMPEEVNRVLVDRMSDLLLCPDDRCNVFGAGSGGEWTKPGAQWHIVGNVMMDSLRWALKKLTPFGEAAKVFPELKDLRATARTLSGPYAVLTVHRPSSVDSIDGWMLTIERIATWMKNHPGMPLIWPSHPRTGAGHDLGALATRIDPLGYLDMVALLRDASLVITDSGGVLEESLYLGKEIVSLRDPRKNERQHLLDHGVPDCWHEDAAPKIVSALMEHA